MQRRSLVPAVFVALLGACHSSDAPIGPSCSGDGACPASQICVDGTCADGCRGGRDCPSDRPLCDPDEGARGACVECLTTDDCALVEECVDHACVTSCDTDDDCSGQRCDRGSGLCVECLSGSDCALGSVCRDDACVPGCSGDRDCPDEVPRCDDAAGPDGTCVICLDAGDCAPGDDCVDGSCRDGCSGDRDCSVGHCDVATGTCAECLSKDQCPLGDLCLDAVCLPGCEVPRDCPSDRPLCDVATGAHGSCVSCLDDDDCSVGTCMSGTCALDGAAMVAIPAGTFVMGDGDDLDNDNEEHMVALSAFQIDVFEVTNAQYRACFDAGWCTVPADANWELPSRAQLPVASVTWDQASAYCAWVGKRLPTEAEWERAARDPLTTRRTYPWGDAAPTCTLENAMLGTACASGPLDVGAHPMGATPTGIQDLGGNAAEWVYDWNGAYATGPVTNPVGDPDGYYRVIRGGGYTSTIEWTAVATRWADWPDYYGSWLGFRCAKGIALP